MLLRLALLARPWLALFQSTSHSTSSKSDMSLLVGEQLSFLRLFESVDSVSESMNKGEANVVSTVLFNPSERTNISGTRLHMNICTILAETSLHITHLDAQTLAHSPQITKWPHGR